ncbi:hypothetical protein cypCar_00046932 [Cyprinus carpio]|nr:hypothetical protein cypCar_00046932 [Cyprinus carpio]
MRARNTETDGDENQPVIADRSDFRPDCVRSSTGLGLVLRPLTLQEVCALCLCLGLSVRLVSAYCAVDARSSSVVFCLCLASVSALCVCASRRSKVDAQSSGLRRSLLSVSVAMEQQAKPYMFASLTRPHSEQLLQGLQLLRQDHELCDIVLRVGDAKIHAHKVVLASISPYFKAMFTGSLSEKETSEVEFQCVDEAALKVSMVLKECCSFLESQLDAGNCIGISRFAETYGCHELCLSASKFICQHFEEVCQTEEFLELTRAELDEIVSNDCLNVLTEESVFYALEAWIKYDLTERQQYLAQLLHCVRLPLLSVKFLTRLYEANHLIRDDHACKHLLNEALKYHFMPEHRLSYQTVLSTRPRCAPKVLLAVGGKAGLFATLER